MAGAGARTWGAGWRGPLAIAALGRPPPPQEVEEEEEKEEEEEEGRGLRGAH